MQRAPAVRRFILRFPVRIMEDKWDQALDVREIDLMQAPVEHIHQAALQIPEPFPISVYVLFGDGTGGFALANSSVRF